MENPALKAIYQIEDELQREKIALKEFSADFKDQQSDLDSYNDYLEAKQKLAEAKKALKRDAEANSNLVMATENIALVKDKIRDLKDILSFHLSQYRADTGNESIPAEDEPSSSQPIIISAKLGNKTVMGNKRE